MEDFNFESKKNKQILQSSFGQWFSSFTAVTAGVFLGGLLLMVCLRIYIGYVISDVWQRSNQSTIQKMK